MKKAHPGATRAQHRVRVAYDADAHAHNLSRWDQRYDQFSAGRFKGRVSELWAPDLQVFLESANQALRQSCAAWPDSLWFGLAAPHPVASRIDTALVPDYSVLFRRGGCQFELYTPEHYDLFGIVVNERMLCEHLDGIEGVDPALLGKGGELRIDPLAYQALIQTLRGLLCPPAASCSSARFEQARDAVLLHLGAALATGHAPPQPGVGTRIRHSRQIVDRARELVLSCPEQRLTIADLCRRLQISRRALQYCFQEIVGMAPLSYLRTLRLNEVRRGLHAQTAPAGRVTQVATHWGFDHLGQFSQDYHKLFGEPPSATLRNQDP
ncbi:MAG TPA: helix-turn-helix domain-containing protein [Castellaniella sp.]|nr:helix-turn-helix domain-containing protein [Castellaniella sp.]